MAGNEGVADFRYENDHPKEMEADPGTEETIYLRLSKNRKRVLHKITISDSNISKCKDWT